MSDETRLLHALEQSGIRRIAVVDDAFDPPEIPASEWGDIRSHLLSSEFKAAIADVPGMDDLYDGALEAIESNDLDSDGLIRFQHLSFAKFAETRADLFDLGRHFSRSRAASLDAVQPILALLNKAVPAVEVTRIGSMEDEDFAARIADIDLIFADFYLDSAVTPEDGPDDKRSQDAKEKSQEMIGEIIKARGKVPSIILMSSKNVASLAGEFKKSLAASSGQIVSARFQFVEKNQITVNANGGIEVQEAASDVLLDILQTFKFAEGLSVAIELWRKSAYAAITDTAEAVGDLEIRDFAYLIRFRLEKEGQDLIEYMEWLLGEYLIDETARRFYSAVQDTPTVRELAQSQKSVQGAYDGQTQSVGKLYHRVRVEEVRPGRAPGFRMGDLYLDVDGKRISAVITPDCDLVVRDGTRASKRLTMVNGIINAFDRGNNSASEFILINEAAKNITWQKKNVETQSFAWAEEKDKRSWIGTLRPMYAQQLQRAVLHDMGRVGMPPWPALYVNVTVELRYFDQDRVVRVLNFAPAEAKSAIVMPKRPDAPKDKHSVIFRRSMVRAVRKALLALKPEAVLEAGRVHLEALGQDEAADALANACGGVSVETVLASGIFLSVEESPPAATWAWLTIRI